EKEASSSKRRYDDAKNARWRDLDGKRVYWKVMNASRTESKHLSPRFNGPYLAEKTDSKWNYRIRDRTGNSKVVHVDQLKECTNTDQQLDILRNRGRPRRVYSVTYYRSDLKT